MARLTFKKALEINCCRACSRYQKCTALYLKNHELYKDIFCGITDTKQKGICQQDCVAEDAPCFKKGKGLAGLK